MSPAKAGEPGIHAFPLHRHHEAWMAGHDGEGAVDLSQLACDLAK
jgi:hypothetical protein